MATIFVRYVAIAMLLAALPAVGSAQAAPPGALACTGCHDATVMTDLSLEDMTAEQIVAAITDIRSGARDATLMDRIAIGFTDTEINAIARWLAIEGYR
ncbi:hypothetical protein [Pseudoruegeria sp. HB172150]|uniref:c-type cytochrome n=1 Tax=Pseudoruegeria sp. HB172150 TaxID=2721164 RepID=UPI001C12FBCD|nr:hypothetical protein [Pseudoruegeria sp. HB172150]